MPNPPTDLCLLGHTCHYSINTFYTYPHGSNDCRHLVYEIGNWAFAHFCVCPGLLPIPRPGIQMAGAILFSSLGPRLLPPNLSAALYPTARRHLDVGRASWLP